MAKENNIPESGLTIYQSPNSLKESNSVKWLDRLFSRPEVKANFSLEDKKPDIDGTFEILKNARFDGRFEVQIKTYNPRSSRNKPTYSCSVKLLNYALKNRLSCVLLFVVDTEKNKSFWKYLTESYINHLNIKPTQKHITILFNENEFVDESNFNQCLKKWHTSFLIKNNGLFFEDSSIEESKKKLSSISKYFENIQLSTLSKEDIICIQKFIDRFNYLLDGDFHFLKRFHYPEMWKMGMAIGTYSSTSLTYVLYPIFWGSNDFILKKIKFSNFSDLDHFEEDNYLLAVTNGSRNAIKSGAPDIIMEHIDKKIKELLERRKFLFLTPEIAIEHIFDAIQENHRFWKIEIEDSINVKELKDYLERNFSSSIYPLTIHFSSSSFSNLSTVYHCLSYLINNNIEEIKRIFTRIPNEKDSTYPEYLFNKITSVYSLIPPTFDAFMYYAFPSLREKVSFWNGFNLISINFITQESNYYIIVHYFKRLDGVQEQPKLIFTKNFSHELYKNYPKNGFYDQDYFKYVYNHNAINYKLYAIQGDDIYLFKRRFSIFNQLYNYLIRRFNQNYLKKDNQVFPRESI
jgi:hypothetical protein